MTLCEAGGVYCKNANDYANVEKLRKEVNDHEGDHQAMWQVGGCFHRHGFPTINSTRYVSGETKEKVYQLSRSWATRRTPRPEASGPEKKKPLIYRSGYFQ